MMTNEEYMQFDMIFTADAIAELFPNDRTDRFFDALFGDADEGAYDIRLAYSGYMNKTLYFEYRLSQRPGKCLSCSLTYGLPQVFTRHPIIDIKGLVAEIEKRLEGRARCKEWRVGATREISPNLHAIPLIISIIEDKS